MAKLTLSDIANLSNETTAVSTINANSALTETALENTLSRDGTSPNQMGANLDMNSNRITNLPSPTAANDAVRLQDMVTFTGGGTVDVGLAGPVSSTDNAVVRWNGTSGGTIQNSGVTVDDSNNITSPGKVLIKDGYPWADVRAWGAVGDGVADDSSAFASAISALATYGGGIVFAGPGNYSVISGVSIGGASTGNITIQGAGRNATFIQAWHTDVVVISVGTTGQCWLKDLTVYAKGINVDTGTFGATANGVEFASTSGGMENCTVWGGNFPLKVTATDAVFRNVETSYGYGTANTYINGSCWFSRGKWNHSTTAVANTTALPIPARANTTSYSSGNSVTSGGYVLTCQTSGTSGGSSPTLLNYGRNITDGTVVWQLGAPATFSGMYIDTAAGENHFDQIDLTGLYSKGMTVSGGSGTFITFADSVVAKPVSILSGKLMSLHGCELGDDVTIDTGYTGITQLVDNFSITDVSDIDITVGANVNGFIISDNYLGGGTITVTAGTSNVYQITGNVNATVVDGGTGTNKLILDPVSSTIGGLRSTSATAGIGYGTGAGGTVTQSTNKSTGVTLNKATGTITMNNAALNTVTSVAFTLTNSVIAATDLVIVNIKSGATANSYFVSVDSVSAGSCSISLRNYSGGNLSEAVVLSFAVIKGVAA